MPTHDTNTGGNNPASYLPSWYGVLFYEGNKLIRCEYDGTKFVYSYDAVNDNLIKVEAYEDNILQAYTNLQYNTSGQLISYFEYFLPSSGLDDRTYKTELTYDINTITENIYASYSGNSYELIDVTTITYENGNIKEVVSLDYLQSTNELDTANPFTITYTYDNKNSAYKNIHAIDILSLLGLVGDFHLSTDLLDVTFGIANNIIAATSEGVQTDNIELYEYTLDYIYNSDNYPTSVTQTEDYTGIFGSYIDTYTLPISYY